MALQDLGKSRHGIPDVVMQQIDKYVDSLAPRIQPQLAAELDTFQRKTLDSLDLQIVDAFRSLFPSARSGSNHGVGGGGSFDPIQCGHASRSIDARAPDVYGGLALPFADELTSVTRAFQNVADDAGDDLRQIFSLTEPAQHGQSRSVGTMPQNGPIGQGTRGFLSAAIDAVSDAAGVTNGFDASNSPSPPRFGGLLDVLSDTVKDASRNPEDKARMISPQIKEKVGGMLRKHHGPVAEQFTQIALDHIKRWLRGNTSARDLGDGLRGEISSLVSGFSGLLRASSGSSDQRASTADAGPEGSISGVSGMISKKLSTGLANVHRDVRLDFRKVLGGIEKQLFEALPNEVQGPLERVLGGNPFDSSLDSTSSNTRGFGGDIKANLVESLRRFVRKIQESLRQSILAVVNGGHRKFESASWRFVQEQVESKVRKVLPNVRIHVPDDVGDQGVSVGQPHGSSSLQASTSTTQLPQAAHQPPLAPAPSAPLQFAYHSGPAHQGASQLTASSGGYPAPYTSFAEGADGPIEYPSQGDTQPPPPYTTFQDSSGPQPAPSGFPMPQAGHEQWQPQPLLGHDPHAIVATQKFRSSKAVPGRRQNQQEAVVDDWDAESDGEDDATYRSDPFQASKDEWTKANNQAPASMPMINDNGRTLPPTAYGSGLFSGHVAASGASRFPSPDVGGGVGAYPSGHAEGISGGSRPALGFPQPLIHAGGGRGGGPAPPKILQRPRNVPAGVGMGGSSSAANTAPERKTVEQRQEEYRLARARIFGEEPP